MPKTVALARLLDSVLGTGAHNNDPRQLKYTSLAVEFDLFPFNQLERDISQWPPKEQTFPATLSGRSLVRLSLFAVT
jgi:hypothetical protein